ncbi:F-box LRR-repeat [Lecanosticta acicola]|uniref:F-box LRR-repeat n=1 Tax=Lecanosticta acicola TaxID=111012 RepID=A0AAI9E648_9PEZI|nr:F-box LRR-repeat [Lecanosticta acicola]
MASTSSDSIGGTEGAHTPIGSPQSATISSPPFQEQPPKLRGRKKLFAGLHRISSSPSIARLGNSRTRGYTGTGKGSISCISLNSASSLGAHPFGSQLSREESTGYGTPSPSTATTPGIQSPFTDENARLRYLHGQDGKVSVGLPSEFRPASKAGAAPGIAEVDEDYFSRPVLRSKPGRRDFNFWRDLPSELRMEVLTYLDPKEIVRCSLVSQGWHRMCFDGQLWSILDTSGFYRDISGDSLVKLITSAGPFVRDLNLRGCVQLRERWNTRDLTDACKNLENFSLEGCRIDRASIHNFLWSNNRLVHVNLSGLAGATNHGMKILGANCPKLECLNISWCNNIDTRGLKHVITGCPGLKDLRAGEIRGWDDLDIMHEMFLKNTLERLILMNCNSLSDESLSVLLEGREHEIDYITGRPVVPPRRFKHLDLTRCRGITDQGVRTLVNNIPEIEGLQLSKCHGILDATLTELLPTTPMLTHLDLEELEDLTNLVPQALANAPCAKRMRHLSISYCESIGDAGMLPVLKSCTNLQSLEMDNTRIGDLVLAEAAAMVRQRVPRTTIRGPIQPGKPLFKPSIGLRLVAYDCQNVTWTGVREILSRNADLTITTHTKQLAILNKSSDASASSSAENLSAVPRVSAIHSSTFPTQVIQLKCFYTYQPTVEEHTKRVLRGDFMAARRLERKWAEYMIAQEEAGAQGVGRRRRQRRAREAQMMHADEEDANMPGLGVGGGRRRRARSGGCMVM